jgi:hypothetical protein
MGKDALREVDLLKGVFKKSILIVVPAAVVSALYIDHRKAPLGILLGWFFGIMNLRQLTRNVKGLFGSEKATLKLLFLSMTRLLALFSAIIVLVYYRIVNVFGLLFGFTVVFLFILIEGARAGKQE